MDSDQSALIQDKKQKKIITKDKIENIIFSLTLVIIAGVFLTLAALFLLVPLHTPLAPTLKASGFIILFCTGFVLIPQALSSKKNRSPFFEDIHSLFNLKRVAILFILGLALGLIFSSPELVFFNFIIATTEEILFRHIIHTNLRKTHTQFQAALIGSLLFALVLHLNVSFINNLLFKVPVSLIFYWLAHRYKLQDSIFVHWMYNVAVASI